MRRVANQLRVCPQSRHGYRLDLGQLARGFACREIRVDMGLACVLLRYRDLSRSSDEGQWPGDKSGAR